MEPNQAGQKGRDKTEQRQGRAGQGCAGQRQETVLADLARMSEPEHDSVQMLIDNEQQVQKPMLTCIRSTSSHQ